MSVRPGTLLPEHDQVREASTRVSGVLGRGLIVSAPRLIPLNVLQRILSLVAL